MFYRYNGNVAFVGIIMAMLVSLYIMKMVLLVYGNVSIVGIMIMVMLASWWLLW